MATLFKGMTLLRQSSTPELASVDAETALKNVPLVGLYFSAAWCGPCKRFTPLLKQLYENQEIGIGKMMEIVFVSNDYSESSMLDYYRHEHGSWLTLPFHPEDDRMLLNDKYRITGIPSLVIVGKQGNTISMDAKAKLATIGIDGFRNWLFSKVPLVVELDMLLEQWKQDWLKEKADQLEKDFLMRQQMYHCICSNKSDQDNTVSLQNAATAVVKHQVGSIIDVPVPDRLDIIAPKRSSSRAREHQSSKQDSERHHEKKHHDSSHHDKKHHDSAHRENKRHDSNHHEKKHHESSHHGSLRNLMSPSPTDMPSTPSSIKASCNNKDSPNRRGVLIDHDAPSMTEGPERMLQSDANTERDALGTPQGPHVGGTVLGKSHDRLLTNPEEPLAAFETARISSSPPDRDETTSPTSRPLLGRPQDKYPDDESPATGHSLE